MITFRDARDEAKKRTIAAEHLLTKTYPLIKEPKLLLNITKDLLSAVKNGVLAILLYESSMNRLGRKIPLDFKKQIIIFKKEIVKKYGLPEELIRFFEELEEIIAQHKKSPVEFSRKEKYVICDDNYNTITLTEEELKKLLLKTKIFIKYMEERVNRNDAKLKRRNRRD